MRYTVEILVNGVWVATCKSLPSLHDAIAIGLKFIRLGCNARLVKG